MFLVMSARHEESWFSTCLFSRTLRFSKFGFQNFTLPPSSVLSRRLWLWLKAMSRIGVSCAYGPQAAHC